MKMMFKYFGILFLASLLYSCNSGEDSAKIGQYTTLSIEKVYDAGKVVKGELIQATFEVKNTGTYPLVIADVQESCTCTVSEYPKDPIEPGETGMIKATVNTDETGRGNIKKPIEITANTRPSTTEVNIIAQVMD